MRNKTVRRVAAAGVTLVATLALGVGGPTALSAKSTEWGVNGGSAKSTEWGKSSTEWGKSTEWGVKGSTEWGVTSDGNSTEWG